MGVGRGRTKDERMGVGWKWVGTVGRRGLQNIRDSPSVNHSTEFNRILNCHPTSQLFWEPRMTQDKEANRVSRHTSKHIIIIYIIREHIYTD